MQRIIIASGPVIIENNKTLLDQQGSDKFWKFCGGKVAEHETLMETAIRRAKEELGIDVSILNDQPFISYATKQTNDGRIDVILVHFLASRKGDITPGVDVHSWEWFDINNLPQDIGPNVAPALQHFNLRS